MRDGFKGHERLAGGVVLGDQLARELDPRHRNASLDPPVELEHLDLQIDGVAQLGVGNAKGLELHDLARL